MLGKHDNKVVLLILHSHAGARADKTPGECYWCILKEEFRDFKSFKKSDSNSLCSGYKTGRLGSLRHKALISQQDVYFIS